MSTWKKPKRWRKKQKPASVGQCIFLLIVGLILGTVFTFGMQYWNAEVPRNDCTLVKTQFLSYQELRGRRSGIKEIAIDCANGERYFIDGVSVGVALQGGLPELPKGEPITLLIHPNSNTIVEFSGTDKAILTFEDTIHKLDKEATGFTFLGLLMYSFALWGMWHIILHGKLKRHRKK